MFRPRTLARAAALSAAGLALAAAPAAATPVSAANDAADWLATQLAGAGSDHFVTSYEWGGSVYSYDDAGLTLDGVFAFTATGNHDAEAADAIDWVTANANDYVGSGTTTPSTCATSGTLYAGALAKLAIGVGVTGGNPASTADTGGRNLLTDLKCRQATSGRFVDTPTDYSGTFSQALAIILLDAVNPSYTNPNGSDLADAVTYLKGNQCTNGAYAGAFRSTLGAGASSCTSSDVDVDATAAAAVALYATGETTAANSALTWIRGAGLPVASPPAPTHWQSAACGSTADSVNSTALATMANNSRPTPLFAQSGPEAWLESQADPTDGWLPGCPATDADVLASNRVRATTQGVLGLLRLGFPI